MRQIPIKKNEKYRVSILDLSYEGLGVAKIENYPIFIENTLPGEEIEVLIVKVGKQFGYGKCLEWYKESSDRVAVDNDLLRTGIAPLAHLDYNSQLLFKQKQVQQTLKRVGGFENIEVLPVIGMENPTGYRNKAQIPVRKIDEELTTGFFRKNSHDLIPIEDYFIQDQAIDEAIQKVAELARKWNIKPYDETDNTGNLRNIIIRRGHYSHQMMVVLVTRTAKIFHGEELALAIHEAIPEVVSVMQNIQPVKTNVILGKETQLLYGMEAIEDQLLGKSYRISATSFFQVNTVQAEVLYQKAIELADLQKTDIVIDAYCGIGSIALSLADQVQQVYGVENVSSAIKDAKFNAAKNEIENVVFKTGDAAETIAKWQQSNLQPNVIIVDPPRKGLSNDFITASVSMAPEKIVYISCNPATFARDLKLYAEQGYDVKQVQPVDMFPQTPHVECVGLLTRKK